jgi:hypothetical protein
MSASRDRWWGRRDAQRILGRITSGSVYTVGDTLTTAQRAYLRAQARLALATLKLDPLDERRLRGCIRFLDRLDEQELAA